jgi:hypothetical protein
MTIRGLVLNQPPAAVKQQQDFPNGSPRLLNLLLSKDRLPFRQQEWPLPPPVSVNPALWGFTDSTRFKLIGKDALPFRQREWPLPTPIPVNPALWGFTESTRFRLIGKDALPFRQLEWPTPPKGREIPSAFYGFTGSYLLNLIGKDALPIRQQEWPLPKIREINPALWGFVDITKIWLPAAVVQSPFNQRDWPNPLPVAYVPAMLGFTDSFKLELIGQDALPFSQTDWQLVRLEPWNYPDSPANLLPLGESPPEPEPTPTPTPVGAHAGGKFKGRIKYWWEKPDPVEFDMPYRPPLVTNPVEPFKATLDPEVERKRKRKKKMIMIADIVMALLDEEDLDL